MFDRKRDEDTLEQLLAVSRELSVLIEDNNQNIKDCYRTLRQIQKHVAPPKQNPLASALRKLLNICKRS